MDYQAILKKIKPSHEFFVGIDSDGCVFDTMELKQKEFFIPNALKYFDLYSISGILARNLGICKSLFRIQRQQQVYIISQGF